MEEARYQFEVNLFGLGRLTQLVIPGMREKKAGKIINVSSAGGKVFVPLGAWYIATKHALEGWSDCLRFELKPFNIDVVVIEPGAIATEFEDVMVAPMLERSGEGPYAPMAQAMAKATSEMASNPKASSPPSVITKVIVDAIKAARPKTRYVAGKYAKSLIFTRKWFGDAVYERALNNLIA